MRRPRLNKKIPFKRVIVSLTLVLLAGYCYIIWSGLFPDRTPRYWRYQTLTTDICDNNLSRVKSDLDGGTDPNDFPPSGLDEGDIAPLNIAVSNEKIPMVQLLLDHHADINIGDGWDEAPLTEAVHDENIPIKKAGAKDCNCLGYSQQDDLPRSAPYRACSLRPEVNDSTAT